MPESLANHLDETYSHIMKHTMLKQIRIAVIVLLASVGCTEKEKQVEVSSVSLNTATLEMVEGETFNLVATVLPKDADYDGVVWASSNASVASVNYGTVTAHNEGTTTITASAGGKSSTCYVQVSSSYVAVTSVTLDKTSLTMLPGENATIRVSFSPDNATNKAVSWESREEKVATVKDGIVSAVGVGRTSIVVTSLDGGKTAECVVTVEPIKVSGITLNAATLKMTVGEVYTLKATVTPDNATNKSVLWKSKDENVATVKEGVVSAIDVGQTSIVATTEDGGKAVECVVTVEPINVSGISLSATSLRMMVGDVSTLKVTFTPENATNKNVNWRSDTESVAVVNNGVITCLATGKTTITATSQDGNKTASCTVIVTDDISGFVSAKYLGGSLLISDNVIKTGSKLNFGVYNSSQKTITVKSVQLIDGVTGAKGNVMAINHNIPGGSYAAWAITITGAGIHEPIAEFIYTYNGQEHSTQARYYSINYGI